MHLAGFPAPIAHTEQAKTGTFAREFTETIETDSHLKRFLSSPIVELLTLHAENSLLTSKPAHFWCLLPLVPFLLVIIDDGLIETTFQFFQRHAPSLCRAPRVIDTMTGVGQASFKALGHPPKEGLHRALC